MLAKPIMLPCQGQTMGNLLVTWYTAIFKQIPCQCCLPVLFCSLKSEDSVQRLLLIVVEDGEDKIFKTRELIQLILL